MHVLAGVPTYSPMRALCLCVCRYYHFESLVHYGALPQTWENPDHADEHTNLAGDGDPLDVCDLSTLPCKPGDVYPVSQVNVDAHDRLFRVRLTRCLWMMAAVNR